jgi:hypothetical protein
LIKSGGKRDVGLAVRAGRRGGVTTWDSESDRVKDDKGLAQEVKMRWELKNDAVCIDVIRTARAAAAQDTRRSRGIEPAQPVFENHACASSRGANQLG